MISLLFKELLLNNVEPGFLLKTKKLPILAHNTKSIVQKDEESLDLILKLRVATFFPGNKKLPRMCQHCFPLINSGFAFRERH